MGSGSGAGLPCIPYYSPGSPSLCNSASYSLTCQDTPLAPNLKEGNPTKLLILRVLTHPAHSQ